MNRDQRLKIAEAYEEAKRTISSLQRENEIMRGALLQAAGVIEADYRGMYMEHETVSNVREVVKDALRRAGEVK